MKIRIIDRILVGLSGVVLLAVAAVHALERFTALKPVTAFLAWLGALPLGWAIALCALTALLGLYCFLMLFRRRKNRRGFVMQKAENGEIGISMKAIEGLVVKCVERHEELEVNGISLQERRNGLLIKLRVSMASGMNIPLAVGALQKQIRQYVTACSGVDVDEVRVKVDDAVQKNVNTAYQVPESTAGLPIEEPQPASAPAAASMPVEMPEEPVVSAEEAREPEERPLHQRLYSTPEQPAVLPQPPVPAEPEAPAEAEESAEAEVTAEPVAQETECAEAAAEEEPAAEEAPQETDDEAGEPEAAPAGDEPKEEETAAAAQ